MSSTLTVHGTLTFPPGQLQAWQEAALTIEDEAREELGSFGEPNDRATVREVLEDTEDGWPFVRFVVAGEVVQVRAALGDDCWSAWCGRIRALAAAAGQAGARGFVEMEDDGMFVGRLEIDAGAVRFVPSSRSLPHTTDRAGEVEVYAILQEVFEAEVGRAKKAAAKKAAAKKVTGKKAGAKKATGKKAGAKGAGAKAAGKKTARRRG